MSHDLEKLYTKIPKNKPSIEIEGIVFEAPTRQEELDWWARCVADQVCAKQEADRLGELMFKFKSEQGLTEASMLESLDRITRTEKYKKGMERRVRDLAQALKERWMSQFGGDSASN